MRNGSYPSEKGGRVKRFICTTCGATSKKSERAISPRVVQALALLRLRLTLDQAEVLTGVKSETIRKALLDAHADPERRAALGTALSELNVGPEAFDCLAQVADEASQGIRCSPGYQACQRLDASKLERDIANVLGAKVIIAKSRQGIWVILEKELHELVRRIRKFPLQRLKTIAALTAQQLRVLEQLHTPNRNMRLISRIYATEFEVDLRTGKPTSETVSLRSVAEHLGMRVETLLTTIIGLVRKLRKWNG